MHMLSLHRLKGIARLLNLFELIGFLGNQISME